MRRFWIGGLIMMTAALTACTESPEPQVRGQIALSEAFTGEYQLTDANNQPATPGRFAGKPALIYFGFTACPDVCPTALGVMSATLNELGSDADKMQALFIALDPERDTPEVLSSYLGFDERILGLTGSAEAIKGAKAGFKVFSERKTLPNSALGYTIDHSSLFYFVDNTGAPQFAFTDTMAPQQLAKALRPLL